MIHSSYKGLIPSTYHKHNCDSYCLYTKETEEKVTKNHIHMYTRDTQMNQEAAVYEWAHNPFRSCDLAREITKLHIGEKDLDIIAHPSLMIQ